MTDIADIFRVHASDYLSSHDAHILPSRHRAIWDIIACRSGALGGHLMECDTCGYSHYSYHSCCNRSCPKCLNHNSDRWVNNRMKELLPVTYFHVVFTLPKVLRWIALLNQKIVYDILIQAAAKALKKLGKDPHYIGGKIGFYTVLHTWTRALLFHPHVHCLIPGCGISADGKTWIPGRKNYLFPVKPLADIFRAIFMKMVRKKLPDLTFPQAIWKPKWVVHIKRSIQGPEKVLKYLGRYIHRIAITNNRILSLMNGEVRFRYKDNREKCWKTMTLPAVHFINRFLQHVLPKGFHKVRTYGFLHPTQRNLFQKIQRIATNNLNREKPSQKEETAVEEVRKTPFTLPCRKCSDGTMRIVSILQPVVKYRSSFSRAPPQ